MKVSRVDLAVFAISWLSVLEYYVAETRHRDEHTENNSGHRRRHSNDKRQTGLRPWGQWSSCNAECGTGVAVRIRECEHSRERSRYEMCRGKKREFKVCNTEKCARGRKTLRAKLCSAHDNDDMGRGKRYRWIPYLLHTDRCELICRAAGHGFYNSFPEAVTNGSLCNPEGTAVCIEGVCKKFGCDNVVGSHTVFDQCAVCGGDGSSCRYVKEKYGDRRPKYGYSKIGTIPAGAKLINITQDRRTRNYLALKITDGSYIINGRRRLSPQGDHRGGGTVFTYHRTRNAKCGVECIYSKGPTGVNIDLMLLSFGVNGGVSYSYVYPVSRVYQRQNTTTLKPDINNRNEIDNRINVHIGSTTLDNINETEYNVTEIATRNEVVTLPNLIPSVEVNSGITVSTTILQDSNNAIQNVTTLNDINSTESTSPTDTYVGSRNTPVKPKKGRRMPKYTQSFKFLRKTRFEGRKKNNHIDRSQNDKRYKNRRYPPIIIEDHFRGPDANTAEGRPVRTGGGVLIQVDRDEGVMITGNEKDGIQSYRYIITGYTDCSSTCGPGRRQAKMRCVRDGNFVDERYCQSLTRPYTRTIDCNNQPCNSRWEAGDWSGCSVTCGAGIEKRKVDCVQEISQSVFIPADDCEQADEPPNTRRCQRQICSRWETGPWSQCSVSCDSGIRRRHVTCFGIDGGCELLQKPSEEEKCFPVSCLANLTSRWYFKEWPQECPVDCGSGRQTREAVCLREDMSLSASCSTADKPQTERYCKSKTRCRGFWSTGPWRKCNATCGPGMQSRDISCLHKRRSGSFHVVSETHCNADDKPESHISCLIEECRPQWFTSKWSECPLKCGAGEQERTVKCLDSNYRPSIACNENTKPVLRQRCDSSQCDATTTPEAPGTDCVDTYGHCALVIRTRLCSYDYYRGLCCASCRKADNH